MTRLFGTLVYDGEISLPIIRITLSDGLIIFHGKQYFAGKVALAAGTHLLHIYAPDKSLVFVCSVEILTESVAINGNMIIEQPVKVEWRHD